MSEQAAEKIQEAINLVAVGEANFEEVYNRLQEAQRSLEHLQEMRGEA
jgi:tetrahydromethanopterin S-methyltransferase subunit G